MILIFTVLLLLCKIIIGQTMPWIIVFIPIIIQAIITVLFLLTILILTNDDFKNYKGD